MIGTLLWRGWIGGLSKKEGSSSFLKKRTKKLLTLEIGAIPQGRAAAQRRARTSFDFRMAVEALQEGREWLHVDRVKRESRLKTMSESVIGPLS
jgi:hypothetical protein